MLNRARHEVFRRLMTVRFAGTKAQRSTARRQFELQNTVATLQGQGKYQAKDNRVLDLGSANPYYVVARMLRESKNNVSLASNEAQTLRPEVVELIKAMASQFEPAVETVDELALKAVARVFSSFQPDPETTSQRLVRELALDGGRLPSKLHDKAQPTALRFKYALDGCKSFAEAIERLHNIERRLGSCQLMPTADPGAALLGDYAFVPGPPAPVRPEPDYIKASIRAGDLLPALLWPDSPTTPPAVEQLRLPEDVAVKLVHVQLTQPVGRRKDLGVTHMATVRWDAGGAPSLNLHANTLWPGVVMQPHGSAGWRRGTVTDASAGVPPPPHGYPFPPYLSHEAIKAARNAPAAPVSPAPAAAAPAADAAEDSGSDTHCTWHHALVFDSREERGVRRDATSAAAAATSEATPGEWKYVSWRCRALRTRNSHPTAVGRSETFFKYLPFGQSVQRCLLSSPSGHLALLIERWTQGDAALWAARRLRDRAARRWRDYKDTLAAAVKAGQASQRPPGSPPGIPPAGVAKYCAPGLMLGSRAMFARTWIAGMLQSPSSHSERGTATATASPAPAPLGRRLCFPWPEPNLWLIGSQPSAPPSQTRADAQETVAGMKLVDQGVINRFCSMPALAWRLDKRVAPFVRGHPLLDASTDGSGTFRQMYAWSTDCDEPRSAAGEAAAGSGEAPAAETAEAQELRSTAPHFGVYPIVTPPDMRHDCHLKRWLLEFPLKGLWSGAAARHHHTAYATFARKLMGDLRDEGWRFDGVLHGVLRLSRNQANNLKIRGTATVTQAVAFGVLPEIRAVARPPPGKHAKAFASACVDRDRKDAKPGFGMPFRNDASLPFTAVDLRLLRDLGLPHPRDLDDGAAMRSQATHAVRLLTRLCIDRVREHEERIAERCRVLDHHELSAAA